MDTFPTLTAINVPGMMDAVMNGRPIAGFIRQTTDPGMRVTGGGFERIGDFYYLVFGQRFTGAYFGDGDDQEYTEEIRRFRILDTGQGLPRIADYQAFRVPSNANPEPALNQFHRRDLNVRAAVRPDGRLGITVYGGVFTADFMPYLRPVYIDPSGAAAPSIVVDTRYRQSMSHYEAASVLMFSEQWKMMHTAIVGGISLSRYDPARQAIVTDASIPFIRTVNAVTRFEDGATRECLVASSLDRASAPLQLPAYLGTNAEFILNPAVPHYENNVIRLDSIAQRTLVGHVYGGIGAPTDTPSGGGSYANTQILAVFVTPVFAPCMVVPPPVLPVQGVPPASLRRPGSRHHH
jgi:hypothetical protein